MIRRLLKRCVAAALLGATLSASAAWGQVPKPKKKPAAIAKTPVPLATLLIKTDLAAVVTLDGEPVRQRNGQSVELAANEIIRKSVPLGEHIIEAASSDGEDKWREVLAVDKVGQRAVLIQLESLKTARVARNEEAERAAAERTAVARREAAAKIERERKENADRAERAQKETADRAAREEEQAARRVIEEKSAGLRSKIGELERLADSHEREGASLLRQAEQAERDSQRYQAQGNNVLAAISATTAVVGRQAAQNHQRDAQNARTSARQLERELAALR